ncbi:Peptide-N(4)-(N-acetyl-beta- glucosaminyl)asparagine amidase [Dermatophagoides pteronyssinus]|uniref:Peptide-N(4)-(N-acetyl-beta-glucosaminyl)asparagine amidase n=1 Tax=Dermatophagoides pteronyssinus TaxID=6956 RepID=A0ABQ8JQ47_DERPT|nr:Peptide-N(4)-(N-acetyl-beta- glucosaminyl)asparagine amidase [Dermatophagoides pteronyssinus]
MPPIDYNRYYSIITDHNYIRHFGQYDDRYRQTVHQLIPWKRFNEDFEHLPNNDDDDDGNQMDRRDYCLIRLLEYFKQELFSWVNSLKCDDCNGKECTLLNCRRTNDTEYYCQMIEVYKCPECSAIIEFPRYNHAGRLLETRRGRCGEWALCFAYICFVFGYDIRMVNHVDDHVWTEIYSDHQKRWLHCDPCENSFDNPLLYECGWKKPATLIIANGMYECRDVTWRYCSEWRKTVRLRSQLFDENRLQTLIDQINRRLQSKLSSSEYNGIVERWLGEMVELIRTPDQDIRQPSDSKAIQGRISGSIEWRQSRGESKHCYHEFDLNQLCRQILYDCQRDEYSVVYSDSKKKSTIMKGWQSGCYESCHIFRMIEHDWQMCYLSRQRYCGQKDIGSIRWRFRLPSNHSIEWNRISILVQGRTYESGVIELCIILEPCKTQLSFNLNETFHLNRNELHPATECFDIEAKLMFGEGEIAWQHAQLFRQKLLPKNDSHQHLFTISID